MALDWQETFDDDDNSIWEADSPWTDDGASAGFMFRLKQRLVGNRIEWYDASDAECTLGGETFLTLEEAKAACEAAAETIIAECADHDPETGDPFGEPEVVGWLVYCVPPAELDFLFFGEQIDAEMYASDNDVREIFPLYCGEQVTAEWAIETDGETVYEPKGE